jgi:hypothetical protein
MTTSAAESAALERERFNATPTIRAMPMVAHTIEARIMFLLLAGVRNRPETKAEAVVRAWIGMAGMAGMGREGSSAVDVG